MGHLFLPKSLKATHEHCSATHYCFFVFQRSFVVCTLCQVHGLATGCVTSLETQPFFCSCIYYSPNKRMRNVHYRMRLWRCLSSIPVLCQDHPSWYTPKLGNIPSDPPYAPYEEWWRMTSWFVRSNMKLAITSGFPHMFDTFDHISLLAALQAPFFAGLLPNLVVHRNRPMGASLSLMASTQPSTTSLQNSASSPCSGANERPPLEGARKPGNAPAWQFHVGGLEELACGINTQQERNLESRKS